MKNLLVLLVAAGVSLLFAIGIAVGGLSKKSWKLLVLATLALASSGGFAGWAGYVALHKAKNRVVNTFRPRTGDEIYVGLFGRGKVACTQVFESQDQVVPKIDYAIWLHFKTCPQEFQRILTRHQFSQRKEATANWLGNIPSVGADKWWRPQVMGDTIMVYQYTSKNGRNIQILIASRDGTEVFCEDILD